MQATNIIITGDHVDITLSNDVQRGDTLNTQYIPGTNKVQDVSGNEAAPFTLPVTIELWPDGSCTDLLLTVIDYQSIQLDWINGSTDETGIIAEISTDQVTWTPYTLAAGTETNNFTGLDASTLYYVRVRAVKNGYYSDYTDVESATTESNIPDVPTGLTAVSVDDFVRLTVDDIPSDVQIEWYESENGGDYTLITLTALDMVTTDNYTWQNQNMAFKCRAKRGIAYSDYCTPVSLVTPLVWKSNQSTLTQVVINSMIITTGKTVTIEWETGDTENLTGTVTNKTHDYATTGTKYIKLSGDVNWITSFQHHSQVKSFGSLSKWVIPSRIGSESFRHFRIHNCTFTGNPFARATCLDGFTGANGVTIYVSGGQFSGLPAFTNIPAGISELQMHVNNFSGDLININILRTGAAWFYQFASNKFTGIPRGELKRASNFDLGTNLLTTAVIDVWLVYADQYFTDNTPIQACVFKFSGVGNGIPTGGASNANIVSIINKFTAAGFTATITINT